MTNWTTSEEKPSLPAHWPALAEALRVPLNSLRAGPPAPRRRMAEDDFLTFVGEQLDDLDDWIARVDSSLTPLQQVVMAHQASTAEIDRATERVTRLTEELMGNYCLLRDLRVRYSEDEGRAAFAGVYEHLLKETTLWLQNLVELLESPLTGLRRSMNITVALTSPKDLQTLKNWTRKEAERRKRRELFLPKLQLALLRFLARLIGHRR